MTSTIRHLFGEGPLPERVMILPLRPDLLPVRIFQQDACFTLHMPGAAPLQEQESAPVRLRIARRHKRRLIRELSAVGVTWATLFPDLDHLALQIRLEHGLSSRKGRGVARQRKHPPEKRSYE